MAKILPMRLPTPAALTPRDRMAQQPALFMRSRSQLITPIIKRAGQPRLANWEAGVVDDLVAACSRHAARLAAQPAEVCWVFADPAKPPEPFADTQAWVQRRFINYIAVGVRLPPQPEPHEPARRAD